MLLIEDVSHCYDDIESLRSVSLQVETGEIVCLLGPSGCGKTTLLRIIAGLEKEYRGRVSLDGHDIRDVPAHLRNFGLMFQDFALFPHMNLADNIAYGLKRRGYARRVIEKEVALLTKQVGLSGLGKRDVASLSGGQQQRVALARSLAPKPRLLMLDEPLGSLDARLRDQLAQELRQVIKDQGLTAIYVTHDHREAYAVADRIAVMSVGAVQQIDTPRQLYFRPARVFVAEFLGMRNIFSANHGPAITRLRAAAFAPDERIGTILVHPSGVSTEKPRSGPSLGLDGTLRSAIFRGDHYEVSAVLEDGTALNFTAPELSAALGDSISVFVAIDAVLPLQD